jgi:hypothetical protein
MDTKQCFLGKIKWPVTTILNTPMSGVAPPEFHKKVHQNALTQVSSFCGSYLETPINQGSGSRI